MVSLRNKYSRLRASFGVTATTCNGNDGAVTNLTGSGGVPAATYTFLVDGNAGPFDHLSGGTHVLTIRDGTCSRDSSFTVTFPGMIDHSIITTDADCTNNGKSGSLTLVINDTGTFQVALSQDQFNVPPDTDFQNYLGSYVTFPNLPGGTYYVYMKSSSNTTCVTRSDAKTINGIMPVRFKAEPDCEDNKVSLNLNITEGSFSTNDGPFTLTVLKATNFQTVVDQALSLPPARDYPLNYDDPTYAAFLQSPGEYLILLSEDQNFCRVKSDTVPYTVYPKLSAVVKNIVQSRIDEKEGTFDVYDFTGAPPFMIQVKRDSVFQPDENYFVDWKNVALNANAEYEADFKDAYPGRYLVKIADNAGCMVTDTVRVPRDTSVYIPNVFTPNGDDYNENFVILNLPANSKITIANRWGKEVFSSSNYQNNWNGEGTADGIYFYTLQMSNPRKRITGWVEIMRGSKP
jgi:gliding motility-associated-like protein